MSSCNMVSPIVFCELCKKLQFLQERDSNSNLANHVLNIVSLNLCSYTALEVVTFKMIGNVDG